MTTYEAARLQERAAPDCPECGGDGYVTFTAHNMHGYTEVACVCVGHIDISEIDPRDDD